MKRYLLLCAVVFAHAPVTIELTGIAGPYGNGKKTFDVQDPQDIREAIHKLVEETVNLDRSEEFIKLLIGEQSLREVPDHKLRQRYILVTALKGNFKNDADIIIPRLAETAAACVGVLDCKVPDDYMHIEYNRIWCVFIPIKAELGLERISVDYPQEVLENDDNRFAFFKQIYIHIRRLQEAPRMDDKESVPNDEILLEKGIKITWGGNKGYIQRTAPNMRLKGGLRLATYVPMTASHIGLLLDIATDFAGYLG